jgi:alpha/beta superfamily hydrolase
MQHNKEEDFDIKKVNNLVKNLTNQKNIKIDYKVINSDINFRNKEKQLKNNVNSFILKILEEFK